VGETPVNRYRIFKCQFCGEEVERSGTGLKRATCYDCRTKKQRENSIRRWRDLSTSKHLQEKKV